MTQPVPETPISVYDQHAALVAVAEASAAQLRLVWSQGPSGPDEMKAYLFDVLPDLAEQHRGAAASLAADWYDDLREVVAPAKPFVAEPVFEVPSARVRATIRWGVDPLYRPDAHQVAADDLLAGAWERLVADAHRETIAVASVADPAAKGWARFGRAESCDFCRMLIGRGAVYRESSARFASHDRCKCVAGPEFKDSRAVRAFVPSERHLSDEQRAARNKTVRDWIAANQ